MDKQLARKPKPAFQKPDVKAELKRLQRAFGYSFPGALEPWVNGEPWAKPLSVGFKQECRANLTQQQVKSLQPVLNLLIRSRPYQKALTEEGAFRVSFEGKQVEPVKPEHQLAAQVGLLVGRLRMLSKQVNPEGAVREKLWSLEKQVAEIRDAIRTKHLSDLQK